MSKFKVFMSFSNGSPKIVGTYGTIEEAAEKGWKYAYDNGYTRSSCETHDSVIEALMERNYCMLGYGPDCVEIEEVVSA